MPKATMLLPFLFRQESKPPVTPTPQTKPGFIAPLNANQLLGTERRRVLLDLIWEQTSMSRDAFQTIYQEPIARYAELVQELPASENHHHAYRGGMLDHTLEVVLQALRLRQSYLLPPGAPPEEGCHQAEVWSAAVAYGALCHDVGKVAVDIEVLLDDGSNWYPWKGPIQQPYQFRYLKKRDPALHEFAAGLLYNTILGAEIMTWLSKQPVLWGHLLYLLAGNYEKAETLGEIVAKADRFSTALNIGGNPERIVDAPVQTQQKQWLLGLQNLVKGAQDENRLNTKGQPFWLTEDSLWLVSQTVMNGLRSYLLKNGLPAPSNNNILFDELQSHGIIQATEAGRAIWKVKISDGSWSTELTCVKMKPSLIWGNEELPAAYSGTVEVVGTQEEHDAAHAVAPLQPVPHSAKPSESSLRQPVPKETQSSVSPAVDDEIDAALSFMGNLLPTQAPSSETSQQATFEHSTNTSGKATASVKAPPQRQEPEALPSVLTQKTAPKAHQAPPRQLDPIEVQERRKLVVAFMEWLKASLASGRMLVNDPNAKIHMVGDKAFLVTPGIFQRFTQEQMGLDDSNDSWKRVQRGFDRFGLHEKRDNGLNIWTCTVAGPHRFGNRICGYLIDPTLLFEDVPPNNPFLKLEV